GYADRLYDLCTSVLRNPNAAFDTVVDTFVLAAIELYRLRRPEKLEPWLFALARHQLLVRHIPMGVDEHAEFNGPSRGATSGRAGRNGRGGGMRVSGKGSRPPRPPRAPAAGHRGAGGRPRCVSPAR